MKFLSRVAFPLSLILGFSAILCLSAPDIVIAQTKNVTIAGQDVGLRLGLTIQPRFTYANEEINNAEVERLGFGIRRFRLRTYADFGDRFKVFAQLEGSGASANLLDLRAEYKLSPTIWLRAGRFVGAEPRAMAITLHSEIDIIDRPAIADYWARNTIGADARDYGLEVLYRIPKLEYRVFLHNGDNRNNFRTGAADFSMTDNRNDRGMAVSTLLRYFPNKDVHTDIGGYLGYNASKGSYTRPEPLSFEGRNLWSAAVHAYRGTYAGHFPFRVKADAILIDYASFTSGGVEVNQTFLGGTLFGGYLLRKDIELVGRVESFSTNINSRGNRTELFTAGATYSFSAAHGENFLNRKITAGYTLRFKEDAQRPDHLFVIQLQIVL